MVEAATFSQVRSYCRQIEKSPISNPVVETESVTMGISPRSCGLSHIKPREGDKGEKNLYWDQFGRHSRVEELLADSQINT